MGWLVGRYKFTAPFSLKSSLATSSGGRTNLLPTMYSFKMALINAAFQMGKDGEKEFEWIKRLDIRFKPPKKAIVQNSFVKILRESRKEVLKDNPDQWLSPTVSLREYIIYDGELLVAIKDSLLMDEQVQTLEKLMVHINQLGKRSSFVQFISFTKMNEIDRAFTFLLKDEMIQMPSSLTVQYLDDMGEKAIFSSINSFDQKRATIGKDRLFVPVGIPYKLKRSSRSYSCYERID
ncbi:hypothetical protein JOD45_000731 [Scopulibacillus daqui]|uniref:Uncharacterized protein n=1 Tax=Scopulibacillus daqui TaxID=1469162 RepID=A0ABS2PWX1_9BACL|nr:type I-A CRISPR-associated protein Cas5 [Scopulibacillus daqui]MBM7644538.1 hypothetical protein [Scopulibacillus daqui]